MKLMNPASATDVLMTAPIPTIDSPTEYLYDFAQLVADTLGDDHLSALALAAKCVRGMTSDELLDWVREPTLQRELPEFVLAEASDVARRMAEPWR